MGSRSVLERRDVPPFQGIGIPAFPILLEALPTPVVPYGLIYCYFRLTVTADMDVNYGHYMTTVLMNLMLHGERQ